MNPIYDELVVKYYLSKGIVPFSYPHQKVMASKIEAGTLVMVKADLSKARSYLIDAMDSQGRPHIRYEIPIPKKRFDLKG